MKRFTDVTRTYPHRSPLHSLGTDLLFEPTLHHHHPTECHLQCYRSNKVENHPNLNHCKLSSLTQRSESGRRGTFVLLTNCKMLTFGNLRLFKSECLVVSIHKTSVSTLEYTHKNDVKLACNRSKVLGYIYSRICLIRYRRGFKKSNKLGEGTNYANR